jgi:uncharacterized protein YndB with AHSA1/START domain
VKRDLKFQVEYDHPIKRVWQAITSSEAIAQWLMPNDFQPRLGHKFQFRTEPRGGWDGIVHSEVLVCEPPRKLSFTWKSNMLDTVLHITLEPLGAGKTRLVLEHQGFTGMKAVLLSFLLGSGWGRILRKAIPAVIARMDAAGNLAPREAGARQ